MSIEKRATAIMVVSNLEGFCDGALSAMIEEAETSDLLSMKRKLAMLRLDARILIAELKGLLNAAENDQ